jgi:hypothetical protein
MQSYELCADMIDVVIDVSCIYGLPKNNLLQGPEPSSTEGAQGNETITGGDSTTSEGGGGGGDNVSNETMTEETTDNNNDGGGGNGGGNGGKSKRSNSTVLNEKVSWPSVDLANDQTSSTANAVSDMSAKLNEDLRMSELGHDLNPSLESPHNHAGHGSGWAFDSKSSSVIKLSNGMVLFLREVNSYLALVCILRADTMMKKGLIDYNIDCFKKGLSDVFLGHVTPAIKEAAEEENA